MNHYVSFASHRNHLWVAQVKEEMHWKDDGIYHRIPGRTEQENFRREERSATLVTSEIRQYTCPHWSATNVIETQGLAPRQRLDWKFSFPTEKHLTGPVWLWSPNCWILHEVHIAKRTGHIVETSLLSLEKGLGIRLISLRKRNPCELRRYSQYKFFIQLDHSHPFLFSAFCSIH